MTISRILLSGTAALALLGTSACVTDPNTGEKKISRTAIGTGRGEQLTSVLARGTFQWVFALAEGGLSTPAVYGECDRLRGSATVRDPYISDNLMQALRAGDSLLLVSTLTPAPIQKQPNATIQLTMALDLILH